VQPFRTSVVPNELHHAPRRNAPEAIWAAHPSVMPARTAVPAGMPVSAAAAADTVPIGVPGNTNGGQHLRADAQLVERIYRPARDPQVDTGFSAWLVSVATGCPTSLDARWSA